MSRTKPRITPSTSQAATIGLLTAGLVTVSSSTRYVLAEDTDDVQFYDAVRDVLTDYGPSRDPRALKPTPSIVFLPASTGSGKGKTSGGKSVVESWVMKFDQPPLDQLVRGVIDRDAANTSTARVRVIGRYSIENYLLDPFVVFGVLLDNGTAPSVAGLSVSTGDEHLLRSFDAALLQKIVDATRGPVESALVAVGTKLDLSPRSVTFTNGKSVLYPAWMMDHRGHDLLPAYQQAYGGPAVISPPRLERSLRRVRLIPEELATLLDDLQT